MAKDKEAKGKKPHRKTKRVKKGEKYQITDSSAKAKSCPKCGPGVLMSKHQNRSHCGKCSYTEFK